MLAAKLCFQAGILDVEEWINQDNANRILNFWEAFDRVNPLPDHWEQTAKICEQLSLGHLFQRASRGIEAGNPIGWIDFMPPRFNPPPKIRRKTIQSDEDQIKALDAKFAKHG